MKNLFEQVSPSNIPAGKNIKLIRKMVYADSYLRSQLDFIEAIFRELFQTINKELYLK